MSWVDDAYLLRAKPASSTAKTTVPARGPQVGTEHKKTNLLRFFGQCRRETRAGLADTARAHPGRRSPSPTGSSSRDPTGSRSPVRAGAAAAKNVSPARPATSPRRPHRDSVEPGGAPLACPHGAPAGRSQPTSPVGATVNESTTLTNRERRENVAFLSQAFAADPHLPAEVLDADERARFLAEPEQQGGIFFKLLCYGALAAQPAPESVVDADWRRMEAAGIVDALFAGEFELTRYAVDPPVSRSDSKGKIIDFARLAEARDTWQGLLPAPADPDVAVDVLHAASGGASRARSRRRVT